MARLAVLLAMTVAAGAQPAASFAVGGVLKASDGKPLVSATIKLHALVGEGSHRGRALLGLAIEAASGERLIDVQLTIAEGAADLIGTVKVRADGSAAEALVVAFPADRGLRLFPLRYVRAVRPDRSGGYRAAGLPPGEYLVTAVSGVSESDAMGVAALGRLETDATRVVLPPATVTVHDLTMSRARN